MPTDTSGRPELQPGVLTPVADDVWRLVAPNAGPMTGPGTNSYLVGASRNVLIDPGPALASHVEAIVKVTGTTLTHVLTTHTHADHSPAAALLAQRITVQQVGLPPPPGDRQDQSFVPDWQPADGEMLSLGGVKLRAIHTPGHASNHICYLLDANQMLFTGDHVMQGSTVVIPPPDGDMSAYLHSLDKIQALRPAAIAPGHGAVIDEPDRAITRLIRHRLQREARVHDRLTQMGEATLDALLPVAYADVHERMLPVAAYSLHAHLLKLQADGRIRCIGGVWSVVVG